MIELRTKLLHPLAKLPKTWSDLAAGLDLHACLPTSTGGRNNAILPPHTTRNIPTGIAIEPPPGHFLIVCSRSGLAKTGIFVTNGPGIIDPDYRGEIFVLLHNGGHETHYIRDGDRIGQLVCLPLMETVAIAVEDLSTTQRDIAGLGSTGR